MGQSSAIVYDASRFCTRILHSTPNGIDRLDSLLARGLLGGKGTTSALLFGFGGPRVIRSAAALAALDRVERIWREPQGARDVDAISALAAWLSAPSPDPPLVPRFATPIRRRIGAGLAMLARLGPAGGPAPEREVPQGAVYLNATHFPIEWQSHVAWLSRRSDIRPVLLIHDLLPLDNPEWFWKGEEKRHRARIAFLAERGAGAIVTSAAVEGRLRAEMARAGRRNLPVLRTAPPVAPAFQVAGSVNASLAAARYFVTCGTIEPRKNHALLLRVWRRLNSERRRDAPKLVVVGKRGWLCDDLMRDLRNLAKAGSLVLICGLPTGAYRALLDQSLALLAPSFDEGYGLPVAEARARGVPVLASDIPPFREQGADRLLDPRDDRAWHDAIVATAEAGPMARRGARAASAGVAERDYLAAIHGFLGDLR